MKPQRPMVRYHGGKWRVAPWIIDHLPPHKTYVEPFCGAGSVLMRKPKAHSRIEVLNDKNGRLVNAFRVIRDPKQSLHLREMLRMTPYSESEYRAAREQADDPVEDARRLIVLGHQARGSTGASGGKLSGWRRGIRPHGPTTADEWAGRHNHVMAWADRLRSVYLENTESATIIERWDGPDTVFYVDPPYVQETRTQGLGSYAFEMTDDQHRDLAELLNRVQGYVVLSGYASKLYDVELYPGWRRVERPVMADNQKSATEVLWLSPNTLDTELPLFAGHAC
jgi:DNA adenine methylase